MSQTTRDRRTAPLPAPALFPRRHTLAWMEWDASYRPFDGNPIWADNRSIANQPAETNPNEGK